MKIAKIGGLLIMDIMDPSLFVWRGTLQVHIVLGDGRGGGGTGPTFCTT